jgi:hypothetical protein
LRALEATEEFIERIVLVDLRACRAAALGAADDADVHDGLAVVRDDLGEVGQRAGGGRIARPPAPAVAATGAGAGAWTVAGAAALGAVALL